MFAADRIIFQPAAACGHFQVQRKVRLCLGVNPDKTVGGIACRFDNVQLIAHNAPADGMAADYCAGDGTGFGRSAQNLRFTGRDAIVASADLDPGSLHTTLLNFASQFAKQPLGQGGFRRALCP